MRTIKFRGRSLGEWYYGNLHIRNHEKFGDSAYIIGCTENPSTTMVDISTICQFTGLHDKNGKEIYEGDIVQFNGKFFTENIFCVDYEDSHRGGFSLCTKDGYYSMFGDAWLEPFYCEVIGNIHDNPELLKTKVI